MHKVVYKYSNDETRAWQFGHKQFTDSMWQLPIDNLRINKSRVDDLADIYQKVIVNKVIVILDNFVYSEDWFTFGRLDGFVYNPTKNNGTFSYDGKYVQSVNQGNAPSLIGRIAFLRDNVGVADKIPLVSSLSNSLNLKILNVTRRSKKVFKFYPKCKKYLDTTGIGSFNLGTWVTNMKGVMSDIYLAPFNNKTSYNLIDNDSLQNIDIHFRMRAYIYVTYAKRYADVPLVDITQ